MTAYVNADQYSLYKFTGNCTETFVTVQD